ncbi:MAG: flippase-like domain-containing protein, partial [Proteobacteria bacterium]|nr:flippase-like domain-containing protein [Pseudomonadota bacterium]
MNKKFIVLSLIGVFISVAALYFAFRYVPMADLLRYMGTIEPIWIVLSLVLCLITFYFRIQRWRLILGEKYHLSFWDAYHPIMIGFMANYILPSRMGEIVRPMILKKNDNVPFSTGLATVTLERIFDLMFMLLFLTVCLTRMEIDDSLSIPFGDYILNKGTLGTISRGMLCLLLFLLAGVVTLAFSLSRNIIQAMVIRIPALFFFLSQDIRDKMGQKICKPVNSLIDNFSVGLSQIRDLKSLFGSLFFSAAVWVFSALSYYVMTFGSPGVDMT